MAIAFHWAIALLIAVNWPIGHFGETIEARLGLNLVPFHKSIGLTVLALSILRLVWRLSHRPPPLPLSISRWRARAARFTHAAFYVLIIALPLTGWLRASAGRYPLTWFGLLDVPKFPIARQSAEAALAIGAHKFLAWTMLTLVVVHVAAALHHHLKLKDAVLLRMLPKRARSGQAPHVRQRGN
ncbi:cytochrome b [Sphingomonas sp.]|uniref:cytochrome b n=1 Tax=Sphingomonas sp. TaxID=28214 RepID=UPI0025ECF79E|nr:cytochrome b [Sphingomonas sp.]